MQSKALSLLGGGDLSAGLRSMMRHIAINSISERHSLKGRKGKAAFIETAAFRAVISKCFFKGRNKIEM